MAAITEKPLPEKDDDELALIVGRVRGKEKEDILAEQEWQRRLMRVQQEFNREVMVDQHKLNKRIIIIAAIITALSGIFGVLLGKYMPDHRCSVQIQPKTEIGAGKGLNTEMAKPSIAPKP